MERAKTIFPGQKQIVYLDFSDCDMEQAHQVIVDGALLIRAQPLGSVLILSDFTNSTHDARLTPALKEFTTGNAPYVKASASVGVTGMRKILFDAIMKLTGRNVPIFDHPDQAKAWLIAQ
jgi:hypothetical protein